jgi:hypothetical protein
MLLMDYDDDMVNLDYLEQDHYGCEYEGTVLDG